mmetsp:Transcript_7647/g.12519  ORF Transcript_7647/g.12519 Transcript_7647/m.12519 type:complete len:215 (-) Transcript_7647:176-820(-)
MCALGIDGNNGNRNGRPLMLLLAFTGIVSFNWCNNNNGSFLVSADPDREIVHAVGSKFELGVDTDSNVLDDAGEWLARLPLMLLLQCARFGSNGKDGKEAKDSEHEDDVEGVQVEEDTKEVFRLLLVFTLQLACSWLLVHSLCLCFCVGENGVCGAFSCDSKLKCVSSLLSLPMSAVYSSSSERSLLPISNPNPDTLKLLQSLSVLINDSDRDS